jgi:hypothetical protein
LVSITIPESITSVSNNAIVTTNLKEFKGKFASEDGKCLVVDGELVLSAYKGFEGLTKYIIPNGVTTIGYNAFSYYDSLTDITIPDSVTSIGSSAFRHCSSLTSVTIPNSVTLIDFCAFSECTSLTSIIIPDSVTTIEQSAFQDCTSLTSVTIGNGITSIDGSVFIGCDSLARFSGEFASEDGRCLIIDGKLIKAATAGLTEYTIPDSVTTIEYSAFYNCSSLTSVTIPDSVTSIGEHAFENCSSLTSVTIGNGVTSIGHYAFKGCSNLTSVYCKAIISPSLGSEVFYRNAQGRKIYIPTGSINNYKSSGNWRSLYNDGAIEEYNF